MVMTLAQLRRNELAAVGDLDGRPATVQRLMAMGFLPGAAVRVVEVAPFGDPITVEIDSWRLSLRRSDADAVRVAPSGRR
jgi:ferrous iron transport protein A